MADPRTINDILADAIILHATYLERVAAGMQAEYRASLRDALDESVDRIESRLRKVANRGVGALDQQNLRKILDDLKSQSAAAYAAVLAGFSRDIVELAGIEADFMLREFGKAIPNVGVSFNAVTSESLASIAKQRPFFGKNLREWFKALDADTTTRITGAVRQGIADGATVRQIASNLRGTKAASYTDGMLLKPVRDLETVVHTATSHVTNKVREEFYKENSDVIELTQWTATLDLSTCVTCASLDGSTWPIDRGQSPPAHPNCRCVRVPVIKSWQGLGLSGLDPGTRASMDGQVAGDTSFGSWLKGRSEREQNVVLGRERADLFRAGKLDGLNPKQVLGANLRPLGVADLRRKVDKG